MMAFCSFAFGVCLTCLVHAVATDEDSTAIAIQITLTIISFIMLLGVATA